MKIEIAESLIYSYLRHVEGCRIVQTNWKTSGNWIVTEYDKEDTISLLEKIIAEPLFKDIFKKNRFEQLIKQAEIDVLGINLTENSIFGIDVAFHEAGLNYGNLDETCARVMKKLFRTIFIMKCYFKEFDKFNSYFISPKVNPAMQRPIDDLVKMAINLINDERIVIKFISNEDFHRSIVDPLVTSIGEENDSSELFTRAIKLLHLDRGPKSKETKTLKSRGLINIDSPKQTIEGMQIGQFVQFNMRKLFEMNALSLDQIELLLNEYHSKKIFNSNFPILRFVAQGRNDANGYPRYYKEIYGGKYYLTSQWFDRQFVAFENWLKVVNI